jgi:hypothetical protein
VAPRERASATRATTGGTTGADSAATQRSAAAPCEMRRLGAVRRSTPRGRASATHGLVRAAPEQASARGVERCAAARRAHAGAAAHTSGARSVSGCIAPLRRSFAGQEGQDCAAKARARSAAMRRL